MTNLIRDEGIYAGFAQRFIDWAVAKKCELFYSGIVLRELQIKLVGGNYAQIRLDFQKLGLLRVHVSPEDRAYARRLEAKYGFSISYYDLVHLVLSKRYGAMLVTRDRLLSIASEEDVPARRPEEIRAH